MKLCYLLAISYATTIANTVDSESFKIESRIKKLGEIFNLNDTENVKDILSRDTCNRPSTLVLTLLSEIMELKRNMRDLHKYLEKEMRILNNTDVVNSPMENFDSMEKGRSMF